MSNNGGASSSNYAPLYEWAKPQASTPEDYIADHQVAEELSAEGVKHVDILVSQLSESEAVISEQLAEMDNLWQRRRQPLVTKLEHIKAEKIRQEVLLTVLQNQGVREEGPTHLSWVDSNWFHGLCMCVIALNMAVLVAQQIEQEKDFVVCGFHIQAVIFDNMCLVWYIFELLVKITYFQLGFFCGDIRTVWWNYLDFVIVLVGILDQWVFTSSLWAAQYVRVFRILRMMRIFRVLKAFRIFLESDLSWTSSAWFESFILGVITLNALVMGLELDVPWAGWIVIDHIMLAIYTFELAVRLKRWRLMFFTDREHMVWNWLDFVIVGGGLMDSWAIPTVNFLLVLVAGAFDVEAMTLSASMGPSMMLLRILRMFRILRLVRLLRKIRPLYRLLIGVLEAFEGVWWVMVLTIILLYVGGIVFTTLIGRGYIYGEAEIPADATRYYGDVWTSMFSLFKLMNDDQSVVEPIINTMSGRFMFFCFMVISNWGILAILTSVVSDNMIAASTRSEKEEGDAKEREESIRLERRLNVIFAEADEDNDGRLSGKDFQAMFEDDGIAAEIMAATLMTEDDLVDLFNCLASHHEPHTEDTLTVDFKEFIAALGHEGKSADKRSILHVLTQLRIMERRLHSRLEEGLSLLGVDKKDMPSMASATLDLGKKLPSWTKARLGSDDAIDANVPQ